MLHIDDVELNRPSVYMYKGMSIDSVYAIPSECGFK